MDFDGFVALEPDSGSIEAAREALRLKLAMSDMEPDVLSNADSDDAEIGPEEVELEQKMIYAGDKTVIKVSCLVVSECCLGCSPTCVGKVVLSCQCFVLAPCVQAHGSLTITTSALYFTADEESEDYQQIDPQVNWFTDGVVWLCVGCWQW